MNARLAAVLIAISALLSACGEFPTRDGGPMESMDLGRTPDPIPRSEPRSKYGNPETYTVNGKTYRVLASADGYVETGLASWYGTKFHGQYTSSREIYNMYGMTAAHRSLPLPTYVRVTNLQNNRSVIVRVNDRGPFHSDRIIDLSYAAASKLGIVETGTAMVEVRAITSTSPDHAPVMASAVVVTPQPDFRTEGPAPVTASYTPAPKPEVVPASAPAPVRGEMLFVQVGAFSQRENAERLRNELVERENLAAYVHEMPHPEHGILYRVRLGPVADTTAAQQIIERLTGMGAHVVKESIVPRNAQ